MEIDEIVLLDGLAFTKKKKECQEPMPPVPAAQGAVARTVAHPFHSLWHITQIAGEGTLP